MQRIAFFDEFGNEQEYIVKAKFNLGYTEYIAILPAEEIYSPTYILRVDKDETGKEIFVGIDDEELKSVSKAYEEVKNQTIQWGEVWNE